MTDLHALARCRDQLPESGISLETAARCGVRPLTSDDARTLGFADNGYESTNLSGLLFEYRDPRTKKLISTRYRRGAA